MNDEDYKQIAMKRFGAELEELSICNNEFLLAVTALLFIRRDLTSKLAQETRRRLEMEVD